MQKGKLDYLKKTTNEDGVVAALAIDQRGSLKKMLAADGRDDANAIVEFKELASEELTQYTSAILLDPEYGIPGMKARDSSCGLLTSYEKTGYDATEKGRLPDLLPTYSVKRLKELGADAIKILLYYDVDEPADINDIKHAFIERIGSECVAEEIPFFCEFIAYDDTIPDAKSYEFAKVKPHKVIETVKEFSKSRYGIDVLKLEVPVNMDYVEGFNHGNEIAYSREEALNYFKQQSDATKLPYIFLSAGVSTELFLETLKFAHEAGAQFNGVLCGRATWREGVEPFAKNGEEAGREWLQTVGRKNVETLNKVLKDTAVSLFDKLR